MKKFFVMTLLIAFMLSIFTFTGVTAAAEGGMTPYERANAYATMHARRDILSGGEAASAATLSEVLTGFGYEVSTPSFTYYGESSTGSKLSYNYKHVLGYQDNGKGKCVLIGCYYGGYEPQDSYGVGNGASAALSVGTVLYIAEALSTQASDYDVAIAFWGGMEIAGDFDVKKCGIDIERVALYINLDCVAAGDYDYLYADDLPRSQEKYFRSVISSLGVTLLEPPVYKRTASLSYGDDDPYTYTHLGLLSVNRFFMGADVPCVNFVGGSWENDTGIYRYAGKGDIEGTSLDTITSIDGLNGGADKTASRTLAVADVVIKGVTGEGLSDALTQAAKETSSASLDNSLAFYLVSLIGTAILIGVLVFLLAKQGKDRRDAVWEVKVGGEGFDPFSDLNDRADDPSDKRDDDGGGDDVFRF